MADDVKTYEIFTEGFSVVLQKTGMYDAIKHFGREYHYPEIIAIVEHERGQEFINSTEPSINYDGLLAPSYDRADMQDAFNAGGIGESWENWIEEYDSPI